jgi:hypothetical protein
MNGSYGLGIGCPGQAERVLALIVEPVVDELDVVAGLDVEVLHVRRGDIGSRHPLELVAVHVERHAQQHGTPSTVAQYGAPPEATMRSDS